VSIAIAVMGDKRRAAYLQWLVPQVRAIADAFVLSVDQGQFGTPWANAEYCWRWALAADCDWTLLLQDDVVLCHDFGRHLHDALRVFAGPELVTLFHHSYGRLPVSGGWAISTWLGNGLATVLASPLIPEFLLWTEGHVLPELRQDDMRLSVWALATGRLVWVTNPTLVDHRLVGRSLVGTSQPRVSSRFAGLAPFTVDWQQGRRDPYWLPKRSLASYGPIWRLDAG
jgi:hypothetical protein